MLFALMQMWEFETHTPECLSSLTEGKNEFYSKKKIKKIFMVKKERKKKKKRKSNQFILWNPLFFCLERKKKERKKTLWPMLISVCLIPFQIWVWMFLHFFFLPLSVCLLQWTVHFGWCYKCTHCPYTWCQPSAATDPLAV